MKLTVTGTLHQIEYSKRGNSYTVKSDSDDLQPHIPNSFTFWINKGQVVYQTTSEKTHEIAEQIIGQIKQAEFDKNHQ